MEWLAENAKDGYLLLGFVAFMLAGVYWIQKQIVYLVGAAATLAAMVIFWLVIRNVPTTATKIEGDLNALAQSLLAKEYDKATQYVADDFKYKAKGREKWRAAIEQMIADHEVDAIHVDHFQLKSHTKKEANVVFHLHAMQKGKAVYSAECLWKLSRSETWQVTKVQMRKAGQNED